MFFVSTQPKKARQHSFVSLSGQAILSPERSAYGEDRLAKAAVQKSASEGLTII